MIANLIKPSGTLNDIERDTNTMVSLISIANPRDNNPIMGGWFPPKIYTEETIEPKRMYPRIGAILEWHKVNGYK
jgi:hypothetical protein